MYMIEQVCNGDMQAVICKQIASEGKCIAGKTIQSIDVFIFCCQSCYTKTTETTSTVSPVSSSCMGHYWPIVNQAVKDTITGKSATNMGSPQFVADRFGAAKGAIQLDSNASAWKLPVDRYVMGDTTVTMWVKKLSCTNGAYGNQLKTFIL